MVSGYTESKKCLKWYIIIIRVITDYVVGLWNRPTTLVWFSGPVLSANVISNGGLLFRAKNIILWFRRHVKEWMLFVKELASFDVWSSEKVSMIGVIFVANSVGFFVNEKDGMHEFLSWAVRWNTNNEARMSKKLQNLSTSLEAN